MVADDLLKRMEIQRKGSKEGAGGAKERIGEGQREDGFIQQATDMDVCMESSNQCLQKTKCSTYAWMCSEGLSDTVIPETRAHVSFPLPRPNHHSLACPQQS